MGSNSPSMTGHSRSCGTPLLGQPAGSADLSVQVAEQVRETVGEDTETGLAHDLLTFPLFHTRSANQATVSTDAGASAEIGTYGETNV
jgi:hypothetical protein